MKPTAAAVALAFGLSGCDVQEWLFDVQGASTSDASAHSDSGSDVLMRAYCLSDVDCAQPASRCNMQSNKCVGCLTDDDCTQSTPRCDATLGTCVVCIDDRDCTVSLKPHCNPFHSACQECVASADCPSGGPGTVPICDVTQCFFSCADGGGGICPDRAIHCNPFRGGGRCAQCLVNADCADSASGGQRCESNSCVEGISSGGDSVTDGGGPPGSGDAAAEAAPDAALDTSSRVDAMDGSD